MVKTEVLKTPPVRQKEPDSTETDEEKVDLAATMKELARAFAPDQKAARKAFFEIERDVVKAGSLLKQLLCDDDGPEKVKQAIIDGLSEEQKK